MPTKEQREYLVVSDLKKVLETLSEADWIRLGRSSEVLCWGLSINGQDLLNEILCRALEGKRKCPVDVAVPIFLIQAMKSHVSAYLKKRLHDALEQASMASPEDEDELGELLDGAGDMATPEALLIAKQTLEQIDRAFIGDENAQMCSRRMDTDPGCRLNIDPGSVAAH